MKCGLLFDNEIRYAHQLWRAYFLWQISTDPLKQKLQKRLLLRFLHNFKSDLINNMDHMRISLLNPRQWSLSKQSG